MALVQQLFLDPKLYRQLRNMRRAGKKAALATDQAQNIIAKLKSGKFDIAEAGVVTKHGELRIKGCIKYDLGGGYRMVTFKQKADLYLLYAGSHDQCHRWIENHRNLVIADIQQRCQHIAVKKNFTQRQSDNTEVSDESTTGDLTQVLDDEQLRCIFSGLTSSTCN